MDRGFSLVEMLVALTLMAFAAAVVVSTLPTSGSVAAEADDLVRRLVAARDLALIENRPVRVDVTAEGYQSFIRTRAGWLPQDRTPWREGVSAKADGQIVFDPAGLSDPATITLHRKGLSAIVHLDGTGAVTRETSHAR